MVNTCSWNEKNHFICKFDLETVNFKKLSKKCLEKAKTSPLSLQLLVMIRDTSLNEFLFQVMNCFGKKVIETINWSDL